MPEFDKVLVAAADSPKPLPRIYSRKAVEQAFLEAFEVVGGMTRLALWAQEEENYGEFLKLLSKLFPREMTKKVEGTVLNIHTTIPPSPLDNGFESEVFVDAEFTEDLGT